jgi:hypothetical protein
MLAVRARHRTRAVKVPYTSGDVYLKLQLRNRHLPIIFCHTGVASVCVAGWCLSVQVVCLVYTCSCAGAVCVDGWHTRGVNEERYVGA